MLHTYGCPNASTLCVALTFDGNTSRQYGSNIRALHVDGYNACIGLCQLQQHPPPLEGDARVVADIQVGEGSVAGTAVHNLSNAAVRELVGAQTEAGGGVRRDIFGACVHVRACGHGCLWVRACGYVGMWACGLLVHSRPLVALSLCIL